MTTLHPQAAAFLATILFFCSDPTDRREETVTIGQRVRMPSGDLVYVNRIDDWGTLPVWVWWDTAYRPGYANGLATTLEEMRRIIREVPQP